MTLFSLTTTASVFLFIVHIKFFYGGMQMTEVKIAFRLYFCYTKIRIKHLIYNFLSLINKRETLCLP